MRKQKNVLAFVSALFAFAVLVFNTSAVSAYDISTQVFLTRVLEIVSITDDFVLEPGEDSEISVLAYGTGLHYAWDISKDGGNTYESLPGETGSSLHLQPDDADSGAVYVYRVTVSDGYGDSGSRTVRVLHARDYSYRTIEQDADNITTAVSGYLHTNTRLVITPRLEKTDDYQALAAYINYGGGFVPLLAVDVTLVNDNDQVVPFFGPITLDFNVGAAYNGLVLRVFHLQDGRTETLSGTVSDGKLRITARSLSPFMIEVPAAETDTKQSVRGGSGQLGIIAGSPVPVTAAAPVQDGMTAEDDQASALLPEKVSVPASVPADLENLEKPVAEGISRTSKTEAGSTEHSAVSGSVKDVEKAVQPQCGCIFCAFWRLFSPDMDCICPWCWLVPLLIVLTGAFLFTRAGRRHKQHDRKM